MTDTAQETQTCPFCYTELDARATVCSNCHAVKDMTPPGVARVKFFFLGGLLAFFGFGTTFVGTGGGPSMWGVPLILLSALILFWAWRADLSHQPWHRKK